MARTKELRPVFSRRVERGQKENQEPHASTPELEPRAQSVEVLMGHEIRKIALQLFETGNLAPRGDAKDFDGVIRLQPEVAVLQLKAGPQYLGPLRPGFRNIHGMTAHPGNPFGNL